jgi:ankyrin repeat protein
MNLIKSLFKSNLTESLHEACAMGNPSEVQRLLRKNPNVNSSDWPSGFTPLHVCVSGTDSSNRQKIIELLKKSGADLNVKDSEKGLTPLHFAALRNKPLCAKTLIKCGADVNVTEGNGATALHGAIYYGNIEVAKLLLVGGADPIAVDNFGNTPVSIANDRNLLNENLLSGKQIIFKLEQLADANNGQIISHSQKIHFSTIVQLMNNAGATRHGSREGRSNEGRRCIFDNYVLPDGKKIMAGYPV